MMAGKPIVATNIDAIPNIINDGENGLLVNVDDADSASNAVNRIFNDSTLRRKLIEQGYRDVEARFNAKRVSAEHQAVFEELYNK